MMIEKEQKMMIFSNIEIAAVYCGGMSMGYCLAMVVRYFA
jgi:hypothetical protein